jgi:hypothetical protein
MSVSYWLRYVNVIELLSEDLITQAHLQHIREAPLQVPEK